MDEMSLSVATWLCHGIGLSLAGLLAATFYRNRSWPQLLLGAASLVGASLVLAVMLSLPQFNPLRAARLLCFGWFLHLPVYLVLVCVRPQLQRVRVFTAVVLTAIVALTWYSFLVEPFRMEVTRYQIYSDKVTEPLTIGVLADFQTDKFEEYEKASLCRLVELQPDVIVMPGDFLQSETRAGWELLRDQMNAYLREINFTAPQGVFAVGGNTDFRRRWPEIFQGLGVTTMLDTTTVETAKFDVGGLSVEDSFNTGIRLDRNSDRFHIALGHAPDFSLSPHVDADLLIAGHTHGGQVRVPVFGPLVTFSRVPRSWAAGMTQIDDRRTLVVSRGVGMERRDAPRIRFLCRPQLVIIEVLPGRSDSTTNEH